LPYYFTINFKLNFLPPYALCVGTLSLPYPSKAGLPGGHSDRGRFIEKEEVLSAARQIIELSVNKDLYLNVAEAARKRVVQEYSLEKLSKNIRNLYESILIIKK
jgi:glycosyltransferase involved in cell wall biosynthesis